MNPPKAASTAEGFQLHVAIWLERLARYEPRAVAGAFDAWIDRHDEWPLPKHMLPLVEERQARAEASRMIPARDGARDLNQAIERAMSGLASSMLLRLHALHETDPSGRRRIINRLARWAQASPDHTPVEAMQFLQREMPPAAEPAA